MSSLGGDLFYVGGTDEAASKGHLSILWAGRCYDCGCSCVGLWIFPNIVTCRLFDICHYTSEADVNRSGVKIPSQFGILY